MTEPQTRATGIGITDLMSSPVFFCTPTDSLETAARLMWDHDVGAVVVTSPAAPGVILGMITDRDIAMGSYLGGKDMKSLPVSSAMSKAVFAIKSDASISDALVLMAEKQVTQVPVVHATDGHLLGLLSLWRLAGDPTGQSAEAHQIVSTVAAIFKGRS